MGFTGRLRKGWSELSANTRQELIDAMPDGYQDRAENFWKHRHHLHFEVIKGI